MDLNIYSYSEDSIQSITFDYKIGTQTRSKLKMHHLKKLIDLKPLNLYSLKHSYSLHHFPLMRDMTERQKENIRNF